jgi:hypothetical protein
MELSVFMRVTGGLRGSPGRVGTGIFVNRTRMPDLAIGMPDKRLKLQAIFFANPAEQSLRRWMFYS